MSRNYYALLWHATFLALTLTFTDVNTILPALLVTAGGTDIHIGLLTAIMVGTPIAGQVLFASYLHLKARKKAFLLLGINLRIVALILVAVVLATAELIPGRAVIVLVLVLMFAFALGGTFAGVSYVDIVGKSLLRAQRHRFFVSRQVLTSVAFLLSALVARNVLARVDYPTNYMWLFVLAAGLLLVASWGFWVIAEPSADPPGDAYRLADVLKSIPGRLRDDRELRRYIFVVNLTGFGLTLMPFYVVLAKAHYGLTGQQVGAYLLVQIVGMIASNLLWARVVKRYGFRGVIRGCIACGASLPLLALLLVRGPLVIFLFVFFLIGVGLSARKIAFDGLFIEITTDDNRALHKGVVGTTSLSTALFPLLAGILITSIGYAPVFLLGSLLVASAYPLLAER
jgi:MFS family permease